MLSHEYADFLRSTMGNLVACTTDGSIHFLCINWRHVDAMMAAGKQLYAEMKQLVVWSKTNAGMGSIYRSQHELIAVFKNGRRPHINNFGLGESGRYRTNVWTYPGVNTMKAGRDAELAMHPTVKPLALVADSIRDCSRRRGLILDPFAGSGTTIIAAERTGRIARAMELDPRYVDVAIRRWEAFSGTPARLASTGQLFSEVASGEAAPTRSERARRP